MTSTIALSSLMVVGVDMGHLKWHAWSWPHSWWHFLIIAPEELKRSHCSEMRLNGHSYLGHAARQPSSSLHFARHALTSSQVAFSGRYLSNRLSTTSWTVAAAATEAIATKIMALMINRSQLLFA